MWKTQGELRDELREFASLLGSLQRTLHSCAPSEYDSGTLKAAALLLYRYGMPYSAPDIDELSWEFLEIDAGKVHEQREALFQQIQEQANHRRNAE